MPRGQLLKRVPPGCWFDTAAADRVVEFFAKCCTHVKGELAGQPLELDAWERAIVRTAFGWKQADGSRLVRVVYVEVPRKNGKSTLCAGLALYLMAADREPGAEVYSAAADREQATIVFSVAKQMVEQNEQLGARLELFKRSMVGPLASSYKVLSSEAYTKHGLNASGLVVDEVHAQRDRALIDTLHTSTGSRRQPMEIYITTAGYDRESICWELHDHAEKVRDGVLEDPHFLPVIFAAAPDDNWKSRRVWRKANPGLGKSVKLEYLAAECRRAMDIPAYENTFKRLHLNIWTEQKTRWVAVSTWTAAPRSPARESLHGRKAWAGIDLSSTTDITAVVLVVEDRDEKEVVDLVPFFFVPEDNILRRAKVDRVPYQLWRDQGHLIATPGNVVDYSAVRKCVQDQGQLFDLQELAIDRWNSTGLQTDLTGDGFTVVPFGQGWASMTAPMKEFERRLVAKRLRHDGNPVLRWMLSNVAAAQDPAGNIKPDKSKSTGRIDGIVAAIMGLGRAMVAPDGNDMPDDYELLTV